MQLQLATCLKKRGEGGNKEDEKKKVVAVYRKGQCVAGTITKRDG